MSFSSLTFLLSSRLLGGPHLDGLTLSGWLAQRVRTLSQLRLPVLSCSLHCFSARGFARGRFGITLISSVIRLSVPAA
jgi:hypothetical protein